MSFSKFIYINFFLFYSQAGNVAINSLYWAIPIPSADRHCFVTPYPIRNILKPDYKIGWDRRNCMHPFCYRNKKFQNQNDFGTFLVAGYHSITPMLCIAVRTKSGSSSATDSFCVHFQDIPKVKSSWRYFLRYLIAPYETKPNNMPISFVLQMFQTVCCTVLPRPTYQFLQSFSYRKCKRNCLDHFQHLRLTKQSS